MSKKVISLLLAFMLMVSMVAVAAVSVSAETDEQGRYTPSEGTETNRYYFYMPSDWYTDGTATGGIYWWEGTDPADPWPGYKAQPADVANIYYCDVPTNVTTIIWNNAVDGGEDPTAPIYARALQTINIGCEYYDAGESDAYPDGVESFNNMIYVLNPEMTSVAESGKATCGGEWYYYYGNGEYGLKPTKDEAAEAGCLFSTEYQPPKSAEESTAPSEEQTTAPTEATLDTGATETTAPTEFTESTIATGGTDSPALDVANLTVNATSNFFPEASAMYDASTKEVTVTYKFKSSKDVLNAQWTLTYDSDVLTLCDKNTDESIVPNFIGGVNINTGLKNRIKFNASNLKLYKFSDDDSVFATVVFDLKDTAKTPATTTVDLTVEALTVSELNPETGMTDVSKEIVLCNNSIVNDDDKTATVGISKSTELTPATFVPATTVTEETQGSSAVTEPTTATQDTTSATESTDSTQNTTISQDTTAATDATTPTQGTTVADTTVSTSSTNATSSFGGSSTADTSTSDVVTGSNGAGGTVQTGDSSLSLIILTLLCGATCVMFVLRKREML